MTGFSPVLLLVLLVPFLPFMLRSFIRGVEEEEKERAAARDRYATLRAMEWSRQLISARWPSPMMREEEQTTSFPQAFVVTTGEVVEIEIPHDYPTSLPVVDEDGETVEVLDRLFERSAEMAQRYYARAATEEAARQHRPGRTARAERVLSGWSALLPQRISDEVLGDYLEDINRRAKAGESRFIIYTRMLAAIFWTGVNTIGYLRSALGRSKTTR